MNGPLQEYWTGMKTSLAELLSKKGFSVQNIAPPPRPSLLPAAFAPRKESPQAASDGVSDPYKIRAVLDIDYHLAKTGWESGWMYGSKVSYKYTFRGLIKLWICPTTTSPVESCSALGEVANDQGTKEIVIEYLAGGEQNYGASPEGLTSVLTALQNAFRADLAILYNKGMEEVDRKMTADFINKFVAANGPTTAASVAPTTPTVPDAPTTP